MKKLYRRSISGFMALLICFTTILGGGITAFAASSSGEVAKSYSIGFPRSGDANLDYSGTWGHDELHYMNGWTSGEATWMTTLHTIGSFDGPACYCIEPGVPRLLEKTYTRYGEDYWKNYPSDYNSTIDADTIKTLLGRIMQYGYQGDLSLDWRSQNEADADKMAHMMATQVLVWETVVGERDSNFNHVDPGSADAVKSVYRTSHPLYSRFSAYYDSIEASVQSHTVIPSFMSKTPNKAQTVELKWDGSQYTATLTDGNHVVSNYTFTSSLADITFTTNGDTLTITAKTAPAEPVTISASKNNIRKGVVVICYDILDLGKQLMPIGMLVVLDSILNRITQNRAKGKNTFIFIDEIYLLFQHEYSANFLFTLWKRVRKYGAYATGITQNVDDLLQSHTARTMLANSEFIVMLNQASTDRLELAKLLNISDTQLSYITNVDAGHGLIKVGSSLVPFANKFPKNTKLYKLMTTKPGEGA